MQGRDDAAVEGCFVQGHVAQRQGARQDRVLAQQVVELAAHHRGQLADASGLDLYPLAVRARQHEAPFPQTQQIERAEDLRLFATHHVGHAGVIARDAGNDVDAATLLRCLRTDRPERGRDLVEPGRARAIAGFDPALLAADHAGHQAACAGHVHPVAEVLLEHF